MGAWAAMAALLLVLQHLSSRLGRENPYRPWPWPLPWEDFDWYFSGWSQFDGPEYLKIVTEGYSYTPGVRSNIVWFPLYPLLVRPVNALLHQPLAAAILVALLAGAFAAAAVWTWVGDRGVGHDDRSRARWFAFGACLLYPYAWYLYGVVHSDALFLGLVVTACLLVERRHLVAAGLVGALATATRPTGMAVIPALLVLSLERAGVLRVPEGATGLVGRWQLPVRVDLRALRPAVLAPLLSVAGIGAYIVFLWARFDEPLAFQVNQRVYHPGDLPLLKRAFFVRWRDFGDNPTYALTIGLQLAMVLLVLWCVPAVIRRFGFGYGVYCAALVAIPTFSTEDFMGTGRYLIAAFPVWVLLGERLSRRNWGWAPLAASGTLMVALSMGFARSWYLT